MARWYVLPYNGASKPIDTIEAPDRRTAERIAHGIYSLAHVQSVPDHEEMMREASSREINRRPANYNRPQGRRRV